MGSLEKFNLVVLWTTLGNCVNMQISAAVTETSIFFNILAIMHYIISSLHVCSHGQKMLSYEYAYMCMQIGTAIIEKPHFFNIWKTMVSTYMFPWSRIIIMSLNVTCVRVRACVCT